MSSTERRGGEDLRRWVWQGRLSGRYSVVGGACLACERGILGFGYGILLETSRRAVGNAGPARCTDVEISDRFGWCVCDLAGRKHDMSGAQSLFFADAALAGQGEWREGGCRQQGKDPLLSVDTSMSSGDGETYRHHACA